jgi:hypothetical protein
MEKKITLWKYKKKLNSKLNYKYNSWSPSWLFNLQKQNIKEKEQRLGVSEIYSQTLVIRLPIASLSELDQV